MNKQLKIYPRVSEPVAHTFAPGQIEKIGAEGMPLSELVTLTRAFYIDTYAKLFDMMVKEIWLEQKFVYNKKKRARRFGNGHGVELAFNFFMTGMVGMSQKFLTHDSLTSFLTNYVSDLFPEFMSKNPFTEPEYFKYPYKHVTIDFLYVVRDHHERMELLDYAEEKKMTIREFIEFVANQIYGYNAEVGKNIYELCRDRDFLVYARKVKDND